MESVEKPDDFEIAWQNKDVSSKSVAQEFKGKSLSVYGVDVPEIVSVEPTNLPAIEANELRLDNLFRFADGTYGIVDYESEYSDENYCKYLSYVARIVKRFYNEKKDFPILRLIIIYTGDVKRGSTRSNIDLGCARVSLSEAFLSGLSASEIWKTAENKVNIGNPLSDEDALRLIVYPLIFRAKEEKQQAIRNVIELVRRIEDEKQRRFILIEMMVFTDKVIRESDAEEIRRLIMMTKVERIIWREVRDEYQKEEEIKRKTAIQRLLKNGVSELIIANSLDLPLLTVQNIANEMQTDQPDVIA